MRAEGVQRGVQSGRVHYVVLCVRLRQNQVISSTQGSRVAVLWQHASVAGSVMVPGNGHGIGTDDTEFAVTPAVCPTASWRGGARVEASTNPAVAVAVAARRRRQQQRRQLQLSGPVPAELDPDAFARSLALRERAYVSQALVPMPVTITTLTATCALGVPSRRGLRGMVTVAEVRAAAACCPCTTQSRAARTTQETPRPSPSLLRPSLKEELDKPASNSKQAWR